MKRSDKSSVLNKLNEGLEGSTEGDDSESELIFKFYSDSDDGEVNNFIDNQDDFEIIDTQAYINDGTSVTETPDKLFKFLQKPCPQMLSLPMKLKLSGTDYSSNQATASSSKTS